MLDIKLIREKPDFIKERIVTKGKDAGLVDEVLLLDRNRRRITGELEKAQSALKNESDKIANLYGQQKIDAIKDASAHSEKVKKLKPEMEQANAEFKNALFALPNLPSDDTPVGPDESGNKVLRQVGTPPKFDFAPKEHWELGEALDVIDVSRAVKVSGTRFVYLKGQLVLLQYAILQYAYSVLTDETVLKEIIKKAGLKVSSKPFTPVIPPELIKAEPLERMARINPRDERYYIPEDDLFLIGSAEHTLGSMYMDETIEEKELPIRLAGFSSAFRREAGSYSKDLKGVLRVHQFDKLEMESFTNPEDAVAEQDLIVAIQEHIMSNLGVPYQAVQICTGDMGGPDYRQIDIESWFPGQNCYRETHTSDLMTDYQSRRLNTRVRRSNGSTEFVHMNDATAVAMGRAIAAIMENFQQKDGSIEIPEVLHKYLSFKKIGK